MSSKLKKFFASNRVSLYTIAGVISGLLCGLLVKHLLWPGATERVDPYFLRYASLPGTIYIRSFLVLIVPLLITSLSTSLLNNETSANKSLEENKNTANAKEISGHKLLLTSIIFFIFFSTVATIIGISLMAIFQPGARGSTSIKTVLTQSNANSLESNELIHRAQHRINQGNYREDSILNIILNLFPENLVTMLFATPYTKTDVIWPVNLSAILDPAYVPTLKHTTTYSFRPNMIGICFMSFIFCILLKSIGPEKTSTVRHLLKEMDHLVGACFRFLLRFMPGGMFCWMFAEALKMHSVVSVAAQLGYFYALVTLAFCLIYFVLYPAVYFAFTRENGYKLYQAIMPAILVAAGSTSSAITLPMTLKCMEGKGKLAAPIAQTVLPLGVTLHMNGTAVYFPMVALFVAQFKQIPIDPALLCVLGLFSILMSMGLPASPFGGSVIVHHIAFAAVIGIDDPQDVLAFILSFEWIWERVRTPTNVIGDCFVAKCIERLLIKKAEEQNQVQVETNEKEQE